jgi:hypothetical protein
VFILFYSSTIICLLAQLPFELELQNFRVTDLPLSYFLNNSAPIAAVAAAADINIGPSASASASASSMPPSSMHSLVRGSQQQHRPHRRGAELIDTRHLERDIFFARNFARKRSLCTMFVVPLDLCDVVQV